MAANQTMHLKGFYVEMKTLIHKSGCLSQVVILQLVQQDLLNNIPRVAIGLLQQWWQILKRFYLMEFHTNPILTYLVHCIEAKILIHYFLLNAFS